MITNIKSNTPVNEKSEWRTPSYLFRFAESILGGIDFDTACTIENALAKPIWLEDGFQYGDAFTSHWRHRCFCNPDYGYLGGWTPFVLNQHEAITAYLIFSPNGESYYDKLCASSHEIQITGRIAFIGVNGNPKTGNTRGSSLFIINGYGKGSRSVVRRDDLIERFGG